MRSNGQADTVVHLPRDEILLHMRPNLGPIPEQIGVLAWSTVSLCWWPPVFFEANLALRSRFWQSLGTLRKNILILETALRGVFWKNGHTTHGFFLMVNARLCLLGVELNQIFFTQWGNIPERYLSRKRRHKFILDRRHQFISALVDVFPRQTCAAGTNSVYCAIICMFVRIY